VFGTGSTLASLQPVDSPDSVNSHTAQFVTSMRTNWANEADITLGVRIITAFGRCSDAIHKRLAKGSETER
jgi:hypothetical protein